MAKVMNLDADTGKNIIGDDTLPTLTLEGVSSGEILKLQNAGGTGVQLSAVSCPTTAVHVVGAQTGAYIRSGASAANAAIFDRTVIGSATVAVIKLTQLSAASGPFMEFSGLNMGVVSTASAGATVDFGIRVKIGNSYGWLPVYHDIA